MKTGKTPTVLITGGDGFLGSHAVRYFSALGYRLTVLTRRPIWATLSELYPQVRFIQGDIRTLALRGRFDFVLHLAGRCETALQGYSAQDYFETNAAGTAHLLRSLQFGHFILISTIKIYRKGPSAYADSLRDAESACRRSGSDCIVLRCGNIYGPGQPENAVVPVFLARAARHQDLILLSGAKQTLQPLHVDDFLHAIDRVIRRPVPGTYDLVGPEKLSLLRLARRIKEIARSDSRIVVGSGRVPQSRAVDSRKFSATFTWTARRRLASSLRRIFRSQPKVRGKIMPRARPAS